MLSMGISQLGLAQQRAVETNRSDEIKPVVTKAPLYAGLQECLPLNYLEQEKFVAFEEPVAERPAPLGFAFEINGEKVAASNRAKLQSVFAESQLVKVPHGKSIQSIRDEKDRPVWIYPTGTEVVHLISFRSKEKTIFELRMIRKLENGTWAYGSYSPSLECQQGLKLNTYSGVPPYETTFLNEENQATSVKLKRINLQTCRGCHFSDSPADYQYKTKEEAGPCGFVPTNPHLNSSWAMDYFNKTTQIIFEPQN